MKCEKCETERLDVVYYVGGESVHCGNCWMSIVAALPNFNLDVIDAKFEAEIKRKRETEEISNLATVRAAVPGNIKVSSRGVRFKKNDCTN